MFPMHFMFCVQLTTIYFNIVALFINPHIRVVFHKMIYEYCCRRFQEKQQQRFYIKLPTNLPKINVFNYYRF